MSASLHSRKEGNILYLKGIDEGISPFLAKDRFSEALKCYYKAKMCARNQEEASSSLKNIGKAHYQMAKVMSREYLHENNTQMTEKERDKTEDKIKYHAKEALKELFSSLNYGSNSQSEAWCDKMHSDIASVFTDVVEYVSTWSFDRRIAAMFVLSEGMLWKELRAVLLVQVAQVLYQHSVTSLEDQDFVGSLRAVYEMNYPLEEAEQLTSHAEMKADVAVLRADSMYQLASAESMKVSTIAIEMLNTIVKDTEFLDMNMVFDVLDMFKDAALKAREINLEQEAVACYYQGYIFEKIMKLKQKGKMFYMKVMELTEAAKPKLFNGEKWYVECTASLKVMQDEARQRDDQSMQEAKQKLKKELETELNALEAAKNSRSAPELLRHIYSKHPPKNQPPKFDIKDVDNWDDKDNKTRKRLLMKAMTDYHPDKNSADEHGAKWHFLTEEIQKGITYFHDIIKCCE